MTPPTDIDSCSSAKTASLSPSPSPSPSSPASPAPSSLLPSAPPAPAFVPWALASALASALRVSRPSSPRMALAIAARDRSAVSRTFGSAAAAAADGSLGAVGAALASPRDAAIVAYSATCGCVAYFVLIAYASKHLPAELVSVTVAVEPLAVSALGMLLLGAEPCAAEGAGFALAFGGTALLSRAVQSESEGGERGGLRSR
mmetsp:Transcript_20646/g.62004  ORF Transcript_20646/g.62004 Transcript_20646/m.62004 type:complete len:202 (-) Transcript_20646:114-719(-)